jgi:hypothetical protein
MVLFSSLFVLVSWVVSFAAGATYVFQDDYAKYPGPCNNDCYAIFTAGATNVSTAPRTCSRTILTEIQQMKRKKGASTDNQKAAGCVPNPCGSETNQLPERPAVTNILSLAHLKAAKDHSYDARHLGKTRVKVER